MIDLDTLAGCRKCKAVFDISEMRWIRNPEYPEYSDEPYCYDEVCPECGTQDTDNITYDIGGCLCCGTPFVLEGKQPRNICADCAEKAVQNPEMLFRFYAGERQEVRSLNPLVALCFTEQEINGILFKELVSRLHGDDKVVSDEVKTFLAGCVNDDDASIADFMKGE